MTKPNKLMPVVKENLTTPNNQPLLTGILEEFESDLDYLTDPDAFDMDLRKQVVMDSFKDAIEKIGDAVIGEDEKGYRDDHNRYHEGMSGAQSERNFMRQVQRQKLQELLKGIK